MAAIVRLGPGKSGGPLGIPSEGLDHTILTPNMLALRFKHGTVTRLGGKQDGETITDGIIEANQTVLIEMPVMLRPRKYEVITSYNPNLLKHGIVSCPAVQSASDVEIVFLQFRALKKTDITELDYIFELRMID